MSWLSIPTWWLENTIGTRFFTWRKGEQVGSDDFGNRYFREKGGERRWVLFNGNIEASKIPALWHAWIHHTIDQPPSPDELAGADWEQPHEANLSGTPAAYRAPGNLAAPGRRQSSGGDYEPWQPA
ncbi:MAG: NADH:ubiquinone oxidoreductase subunit NDUFA12 [Alphaproteobacteria bacterium]|jgi:NADH:ubiquinone oxidoreductase subunit|nr:NADH:ubiquinone oxidoreductase subunit NDUFA12 [Alphaproteobacteria bacterium]HJP21460.1 NADH:ubiquinone oxidoreductase subunit NDUFA12 [Alphaproteobacteria bacterium]